MYTIYIIYMYTSYLQLLGELTFLSVLPDHLVEFIDAP